MSIIFKCLLVLLPVQRTREKLTEIFRCIRFTESQIISDQQMSVGFFLLVITCQFPSESFAERLNVTKLLEEILWSPQNRRKTNQGHGDSPMTIRDTSYLPETDYLDDYEIEDTDQQLANVGRPDRNLLPVSEHVQRFRFSCVWLKYSMPTFIGFVAKQWTKSDQREFD